jgi:hypothetical protein
MKHAKKTVCRDVFNHICENLDADLNSPKCRAIRKHMEACGDCTTYLDSLKATIELYRNYPIPSLSSAAKSRLRHLR